MMKIHTTQDLSSLGINQQLSTNAKDIRLNHFKKLSLTLSNNDSLTFKAKSDSIKKLPEIAKKIVDKTSKRATDPKDKIDKMLTNDKFIKMLDFILENEVLTNAGIAFLIGWTLRVPTILTLPEWLGGKHKEDKAYAAAHSGASVTMGVVTAGLLTLPVNRGAKYAKEVLYKNIKPEILKKRHPQLDINSIKDKAGNILDKKLWKNIDGLAFCDNVKTPMMVARPKHLTEIAEETYKKTKGIEIDMNANASKESVLDMLTKKGTRLVDELGVEDLFIAIKEEGMGTTLKGVKDTNFFSLKYIDPEFLHKAKPELDMSTVVKDGKIVHPKHWLKTDGSNGFDFDVYFSSNLETAENTPVYTGIKRLENVKDKIIEKYEAYQDNGINGELGTPITNDMLHADANNDTLDKTTRWAVDIVTRIPIGLATVAMIPGVLEMFNVTKKAASKTKEKVLNEKENLNNNITDKDMTLADNSKKKEVSFKGKGDFSKFSKWLGKIYGFKMLNSEWLQKFVENYGKNIDISMTQIMTILGSLLTSGAYIYGTLTNDKLDKDRRNTLAINQFLNFLIPTFLGVYVTKKVGPKVKEMTYRFIGNNKQNIALESATGKISKETAAEKEKVIARVRKGIDVLASLTIFTFIYRYFTPVAITPIANAIGNRVNDHRAALKAKKNDSQIA